MEILRRCPQIKVLFRGDFVCDAIDLLAEECEIKSKELQLEIQLEEFWASEEYFFHNVYQMNNIAKVCPNLRKMLFQFNEEDAGSFLLLTQFKRLQELHNWGGEFYRHKLSHLVQYPDFGPKMTALYLNNVEEMDKGAISIISNTCPNLETMGFYNCIFSDKEYL